jgi:hypothetical protein
MERLLVRGQMYLDEFFDIRLERLSEERGRQARRHDLLNVHSPGIGYFQFTPAAIRCIQSSTAGSKHYPESIAKISSCGNGRFILGIWTLISPLVPEHTYKKAGVFGMDYRDNLLRDIAEEELPLDYGGTRVGDELL